MVINKSIRYGKSRIFKKPRLLKPGGANGGEGGGGAVVAISYNCDVGGWGTATGR